MSPNVKRFAILAAAIAIPGGLLLAGLFYMRKRGSVSQEAAAELRKWEGSYQHLYLDTKGLPTTGIGNLVKDLESAERLPWRLGSRPATRSEIAGDFAAVQRSRPGMSARAYEGLTRIRLTDDAVQKLAMSRLDKEFIPALQRRFPDWERMPRKVKLALIDMIYSLGPGAFDRYSTLRNAVARGDYSSAALASQRTGARDARNQYVRDLLARSA